MCLKNGPHNISNVWPIQVLAKIHIIPAAEKSTEHVQSTQKHHADWRNEDERQDNS